MSSLYAQNQDSDGDGILNTNDLCPNTSSGTVVNSFGCPTSLISCDYTTSSFSLMLVGVAPTETRYLLVNSSSGIIEQINTTPSFSGLIGTQTYMTLAYSYTGNPIGLTTGSLLSGLSSSCQDFSNALVVKVCVPIILPTLSIPNTITVNESAGTATITVSLSSSSSSPISVNYATSGGTASIGSDFSSTSGTLAFGVGETSKTINVPIIDDITSESTENFTLSLSNVNGATLSNGVSVINILDNDPSNNDSDNDGISDVNDLCPNTPNGTIVNAYGCPTTVSNCDFNTSNITVVSQLPTVGKITQYVLADATDGKIVQVSSTPSFNGLIGSKSYMVLAFSYENDNTIVNLLPNNFINQVSASCADWSNALMIKVCSPFIDTGICDYTSSAITINTVTPPPSNGTTQYILVNPMGTIVNLSNTASFNSLSGTNVYNVYAISFTGTITGVNIGSNISNVAGSCLDWSNPLSIKVCVCKPNICLPIAIKKIK